MVAESLESKKESKRCEKKKNIYQKQDVNEKMQKTRKKPEESKKAGRKKEKGRTQARNILTGMKSKKARYKLNEKLLSR